MSRYREVNMGRVAKLIKSDAPEFQSISLLRHFAERENINEEEPDGHPIHLSIFSKKDLYLQELINLKADLEVIGPSKMTPIQAAVAFGTYSAVQILAKAGSNLNAIWYPSKKNPWSLLDILYLRIQEGRSALRESDISNMTRFLCQQGVKNIAAQMEMPSTYIYERVVASTNGPLIFTPVESSSDRPGYVSGGVCITDVKVKSSTMQSGSSASTKHDKPDPKGKYEPGVPKFKPGFLNNGF